LRRTVDIFIFFYRVLLKTEFYILGILLGVSSITGIFNNPFVVVVDDASAQEIQKVVAHCLKCGDLAIIQAGGQSQQGEASDALIGNSNNNIFTTCDSPTPQTGFNALIDATGLNNAQKTTVKNSFAECLANAPDSPEAQVESLEDTIMTTTERAEREIPTEKTLLENLHFKSLLKDPGLNALLENPDVNALLENPDVTALLDNPDVNAFLQNPTNAP
jgi:hypothetical protein